MSVTNIEGVNKGKKRKTTFTKIKSQAFLQLFALAGIFFLIIFSYTPMFGIIIAFKNYKINTGISGMFTSQWVGMKNFMTYFNSVNFGRTILNSLKLSGLKMLFTFPAPILLALAINELKSLRFKKTVQTISYLPYFMSWVVVSGIVFSFCNEQQGVINQVLKKVGLISESLPMLTSPKAFVVMAVVSDVWKSMGWWSIIFIAAITSVDSQIYEAAIVDGASRWRRIWNITLPSIQGTIMVVLIMSISNIFGGGLGGSNFEQCYLLGNSANISASQIIDTYVMQVGLSEGKYSYATAIGLFQSVISILALLGANALSNKTTGYGLF